MSRAITAEFPIEGCFHRHCDDCDGDERATCIVHAESEEADGELIHHIKRVEVQRHNGEVKVWWGLGEKQEDDVQEALDAAWEKTEVKRAVG